jgi:uncharacterized membrane protein YfcA
VPVGGYGRAVDVSTGQLLVVGAAGLAAGAINAVVGSGTLITYPVLLGAGVPPVTANGTNAVGLAVGGVSSAVAYREELRPRARLLLPLALLAMAGGAVGAWLVVSLPEKVFEAVVPWLIVGAVVLVAVQPLITQRVQTRVHHLTKRAKDLPFLIALLGVYGGYFGAGQGVMYMAVLGLRYDEDVQQANAAKNLLGSLANVAAAVVFIATGAVVWPFVVALWIGSVVGGYYGGRVARRIPRSVLRGIVIAVGLYAAIYLVVT